MYSMHEYTEYLEYVLSSEKSCLQPHPLPLPQPLQTTLQPLLLPPLVMSFPMPAPLRVGPFRRNECKKKILSIDNPQEPTTHTMTRTNSKGSCGREQASEAHGRVTYPVTRSLTTCYV